MIKSKTFLVTGSTSGVGVEITRQLLLKGHTVIATYRSEQKLQEVKPLFLNSCSSTDQLKEVKVDLSSFDSVRECARIVTKEVANLDGLVLNAAVKSNKFIETSDGFELTYQTNHLSHFLLCKLLLPKILQSEAGRIICVSSELYKSVTQYPNDPDFMSHNLNVSNYNSMQTYSLSKLYNVWFVRQLAQQLPSNLTCNAVSPGFIPTTDLSRDSGYLGRILMKHVASFLPFATTLQEGAKRVTALVDEPSSGQFFSKGRAVFPLIGEAMNNEKAKRLWDISTEATKKWTEG